MGMAGKCNDADGAAPRAHLEPVSVTDAVPLPLSLCLSPSGRMLRLQLVALAAAAASSSCSPRKACDFLERMHEQCTVRPTSTCSLATHFLITSANSLRGTGWSSSALGTHSGRPWLRTDQPDLHVSEQPRPLPCA